jgi:hypothetical protein
VPAFAAAQHCAQKPGESSLQKPVHSVKLLAPLRIAAMLGSVALQGFFGFAPSGAAVCAEGVKDRRGACKMASEAGDIGLQRIRIGVWVSMDVPYGSRRCAEDAARE